MSGTKPIHSTHPKIFIFLGVQMKILLSSADTGGQFSLVEGIMPAGGDGGLHVHLNEDESMHMLEGALEVTIGEERFELKAGESYFAPRGIPQRLRNVGGTPARSLMIMTPSTFDQFISQAGVPLEPGKTPALPSHPSPSELQSLAKLAESFGIRILAPPGS